MNRKKFKKDSSEKENLSVNKSDVAVNRTFWGRGGGGVGGVSYITGGGGGKK